MAPEIVLDSPAGWHVRAIQPARAIKEYRCPDCDHEVRPGTAHVVAWEAGAEDERRHYHRACWQRFARRLR